MFEIKISLSAPRWQNKICFNLKLNVITARIHKKIPAFPRWLAFHPSIMYLLTTSTWNNCAEQDSASSASVRDSKANQPNELLQVACVAYSVDRFNKWSLRSVDHNVLGVLNEWTNGRASRVPANTRLKGMKPVYGLHGELPTPFDSQLFHLRIYSIVALNVRLYKRFRFVGLGLQSTREEYRRRSHFYISRC